MTKDELSNLKVGDVIYFIGFADIKHINKSKLSFQPKRKVVKQIFKNNTNGDINVQLEKGGIIPSDIHHIYTEMYDLDKDVATVKKINQYRALINKIMFERNKHYKNDFQTHLDTFCKTKYGQKILEKYPEIFF